MKPVIKNNIQPTFLLKNIKPNDLYLKYKSGYFNRPIKNKVRIDIVKPQIKKSGLYQELINTKVVTTGEKNVQLFTQNGEKMPLGGRCKGCLKDFTTEQIGYPLAYQCKYIIDDEDNYKCVHLFWTQGCFHSYGCCLTYLRKINRGIVKDNLLIDAEIMLKFMYHLQYNTNEPLKEDNEPLLLIDNGGSLTQEEFDNYKFIKTNTVIKIPSQVVYNKI